MAEFWYHVRLRRGSIALPEVLPMDKEMVGVVARIHGFDVVVDESLLVRDGGLVVQANRSLACRRVGRASEAPTFPLYLGQGATSED